MALPRRSVAPGRQTLYARFKRPGHAVTGDRSSRGARLTKPKSGYDYAHAAVDDHSRLAFVELLADERGISVTAFVEHALEFYARHGIRVRRVLTDNHWSYTKNPSLAALLKRRSIEHRVIKPYRARTNGKVERFHQTMAREWGYGLSYPTSTHRSKALPHWLAHYDTRRPPLRDRQPATHQPCSQPTWAGHLARDWPQDELAARYAGARDHGARAIKNPRRAVAGALAMVASPLPPAATLDVAVYVLHMLSATTHGDLARRLFDNAQQSAAAALHRCHRALELDGAPHSYTAEEWLPVVCDRAAELLKSARLNEEPPTIVRSAQDAISWLSRALVELDQDSAETANALSEVLARLLAVWAFVETARDLERSV